jgi:hypothetical protein
MSDAAAAGIPATFDFGGRTLEVSPRTLRCELHFANWAEAEGLRALKRHRRDLGEEEYQRQMDAWRRDCGAHLYDFGSPLCHAALFTRAGLKKMLLLKIQAAEAQHAGAHGANGAAPADEHLLDRIAADREKWDELVAIMMRQDWPELRQEAGAEGDPTPAPAGA